MPRRSTIRLSDQVVKSAEPPASGNAIIYDAETPGFGLRITAAGARSFVLNYVSAGRERRLTIGRFPEWSTPAARRQAVLLRASIALGSDPLGDRNDARAKPTMSDLCDRFEADFLPRKRASTQRLYRNCLDGAPGRKGIRAWFGNQRVEAVRFSDCERFHRHVSDVAPTMANRSASVLSKMFSEAGRWGWIDSNPARGIERNAEAKRTRYLSASEMLRLAEALRELPDRQGADVLTLLLLTGCRKGEALSMRWADLDFERGLWIKPASTTKQKAEHRAPLSAAALQLIASIDRVPGSPFVFPGSGVTGHRIAVENSWRKAYARAGLEGVRIHDLRHSFASALASSGASLPLIGALLGHASPQTTHRYAHLFDDPLRAAADRVGGIFSGQPSAKIETLNRVHKK